MEATKQNQQIQTRLNQLERQITAIGKKLGVEPTKINPTDLEHSCQCGAVMFLHDNSPQCKGYTCPKCGVIEWAYQ